MRRVATLVAQRLAWMMATELGHGVQGIALDWAAPGFTDVLRQLGVELLIHTAGPFQQQDYAVAKADAAAAHYIDLADGRRFVSDFPAAMDAACLTAGRTGISGASTVPALSSAVVDQDHGPEIPCMAVILIARRLAPGAGCSVSSRRHDRHGTARSWRIRARVRAMAAPQSNQKRSTGRSAGGVVEAYRVNWYLSLKWLHILSSVLLLGTGFGTAYYLYFANRSRDVAALAVVTRLVVRADWWCAILPPKYGKVASIMRFRSQPTGAAHGTDEFYQETVY